MYKVIGWLIELVSDAYEFLWKLSNRRAEKKIGKIARVDAHAAVMARSRLKRKRIVLKIVYHILVILISGGAAVLLYIYGNDVFFGILNAFFPATICLLAVYLLFYEKTGNISLLEAADVVKKKTPYALYLRAFKSDLSRRNFNEEDLVQTLLQQKVITYAVGLPEEVDASPGAKRVYINNNTWQEEVRMMMNGAMSVFLRICYTEPCLWELKQALSLPQDLYIIIDDAKEYNSVCEIIPDLPQDITLSPGMYLIYKRLSDGVWELQKTKEKDTEVTYDEAFKQDYIDGLLESYPMPNEKSEYEYEKAIEGLFSNMMLGWEQQYKTPLVERILDLIDAYYSAFGDDEDELVSEVVTIQSIEYLDMLKKFNPLEERLLRRKNELLDKVENV